jgi:hypothetical protein
MSIAQTKKKLQRLIARHSQLLEQMLHSPPMLRGSFSRVFTRCGKSACWCAESAKGHSHTRITWSENGKMTTRKVPPDHVEEVVELTSNYRKFRSQRRQILSLEAQMHDSLNRYEAALTEQTRRPLSFLRISQKKQAAGSPRQRKPTGKQNPNT